jgi:hypothetical protein
MDRLRVAAVMICTPLATTKAGWALARQPPKPTPLIAAAPDLLAALHLAAEALDAYSDVNDGEDGPTPNRAMSALQEIDDVIAKAEGKPR